MLYYANKKRNDALSNDDNDNSNNNNDNSNNDVVYVCVDFKKNSHFLYSGQTSKHSLCYMEDLSTAI